jgi:RHS repeat-associated protein
VTPYGQGKNSQLLQSDGVNTYTWDDNGNLATKGATNYTWDYEDRLVGISTANASYAYDYAGRRIKKTVSGTETAYLYNGEDIVKETNGALVMDYLHGIGIDEPVMLDRSGAKSYYFRDGLGSIREITDSAGTIQNSYTYGAWGEILNQTTTIPNIYGYTSREFSEDGIYFYRARYMNPSIGRFISEDSYRFSAGIHLYQYVGNDPVKHDDPLGMEKPLTTEEEANCKIQISYALSIVAKVSKDPCCRGFFERRGCNLNALIELTDKNVEIGSLEHCINTEKGPTWGYGFWENTEEKTIYICPYACRMGRWLIAAAIIHELAHKCQSQLGLTLEEDEATDAQENCIELRWVASYEITVINKK